MNDVQKLERRKTIILRTINVTVVSVVVCFVTAILVVIGVAL